ncbi:MAG: hypothetical protein AABW46_00510 [Nanoarchaeota archaeon]
MGFWSWLFGYSKKDEQDSDSLISEENIQDVNLNKTSDADIDVYKRRIYRPRTITREDARFVENMHKKAAYGDIKIQPYKDSSDIKEIEKITHNVKEKLVKK